MFIIWASGLVPCVINSYVGVKMSNPTLIQMARTYGASDWQIFKDICVPSALPMVFGGLQIALATAWTALVAAELIAADAGLGFLITMGRRLGLPEMVVLGMLLVGLTGVAVGVVVVTSKAPPSRYKEVGSLDNSIQIGTSLAVSQRPGWVALKSVLLNRYVLYVISLASFLLLWDLIAVHQVLGTFTQGRLGS